MENNKSYSILCIDDERDLLDLLADEIQRTGFAPLVAGHAEEALSILNKNYHNVALIICDVNMPEINGFDLRRKILESDHFKPIPFIICSAHVSREEALRAVELKISGFLDKPFTSEAFASTIAEQTKDRVIALKEEEELRTGFVLDSEPMLEEMEGLLLDLDEEQNPEQSVNRIFAIAHTIKGASGFFYPRTLHEYTHKYEDFLSRYKNGAEAIPKEAVSVLLQGLDTLKVLINAFKQRTDGDVPLNSLIKIFDVDFGPTKTAGTGTQPQSDAQPARKNNEVRVSIELLNDFMELSGEITVIRNMLNKLVRTIEKNLPGNRDIALLSDLLEEMHRVNSFMQNKILELRKVPLKSVYRPLQRAVRDLANSLGKDVNFVAQGEEILIDTALAEVLNSSLIHMIRNSLDHGIEAPDTRTQAGKPAQGKLTIESRIADEDLVIEITDDGAGIDPSRIRKKLLEKALFPPEKVETMTDDVLRGMIFESGFSTAAAVTNVSGRGVGMDMVKKSIQKAGGKIAIRSAVGNGTSFLITIPLPKSVTIISSLLVKAGSNTYAIPQDRVRRLVQLEESTRHEHLRKLQGADAVLVDGKIIPLVNLQALLRGATDADLYQSHEGELQIAIVAAGETEFGLLLEQVLDMEDIVVKKLERFVQGDNVFSGATFLGDGRVGLILDIDSLAARVGIVSTALGVGSQSAHDFSETKAAASGTDYLSFALGPNRLYSLPLDSVWRVETLSGESVQRTGTQPVMIYRDRLMPLFFLNHDLQQVAPPQISKESAWPAVIIRQNDCDCALVVERINGLVTGPTQIDESIRDHDMIAGSTILGGETHAVLNVQYFVTKISRTNAA